MLQLISKHLSDVADDIDIFKNLEVFRFDKFLVIHSRHLFADPTVAAMKTSKVNGAVSLTVDNSWLGIEPLRFCVWECLRGFDADAMETVNFYFRSFKLL